MVSHEDIEAESIGPMETPTGKSRPADSDKTVSGSSSSPEPSGYPFKARPANINFSQGDGEIVDDVDDNLEDQLSPEMEAFDPEEHMRAMNDSEEDLNSNYDWWFASTAIPLLAATIGPMANVTSIAALVSPWRDQLLTSGENAFDMRFAHGIPDPKWAISVNALSLGFGVVGNVLLMFNYARAIRYRYAMPLTILFWYLATTSLVSILVCLHKYDPPTVTQALSQAYWYGVISASLYFFSATILFVNIFGYTRGHYPAHIESSKSERSLMLQTILFFAWLAGGAGVFARIEHWSFANAMYFCNVTLLTVGFGDIFPASDVGRGLVFPFSVGGIIMLGLVVNAIWGFVRQLGHENIIRKRVEKARARTFERAVTRSVDLEPDSAELKKLRENVEKRKLHRATSMKSLGKVASKIVNPLVPQVVRRKQSKRILLRASRDRFNAMRKIQENGDRFKRYTSLAVSVTVFFSLWLLGAIVFWRAEQVTQGLSYFQALYFCYVSLLTIGYGDLSPRSNAGRSFFLLWSLLSVPSITILISSMGDTVIKAFQNATFAAAEWTLLPRTGLYSGLLKAYRIKRFGKAEEKRRRLKERKEAMEQVQDLRARRLKSQGSISETGGMSNIAGAMQNIAGIATAINRRDSDTDYLSPSRKDRAPMQLSVLLKFLTEEIRRVARHTKTDANRKYSYDEWVKFTKLIRACEEVKPHLIRGEDGEMIEEGTSNEGFVLWDWIGEDSPLMDEASEPEWLLDRLCSGMMELVQHQERRMSVRFSASSPFSRSSKEKQR